MAHEASESRIWSGLHFRSDVEAGTQLGMDVSKAVIEYAEAGGSEEFSLPDLNILLDIR